MVVANLQESLASDFYWADSQEPHISRRREILAAHPEIKSLFGPDIWAFPKVLSLLACNVAFSSLLLARLVPVQCGLFLISVLRFCAMWVVFC